MAKDYIPVNKFRKMRMTELLDAYPNVDDEDSPDFMEVFWDRFPWDVLQDESEEYLKSFKELSGRVRDVEKLLDVESRILKRIDKLTDSVQKLALTIRKRVK